jgi:uncharacterized protein (TIGR03435 family)
LRPVQTILAIIAAGMAYSQPSFEVASIKPAPAAQLNGSSGIFSGHGRIDAHNVTLRRCIMGAFGIGPHQLSGGPPWLDSDRFEILAKAEQPVDDDSELMAMLRTLLAERFQLTVHRETRTVSALVLEVARNGPRLEKAQHGSSAVTTGSGTSIQAKSITMRRFAEVLSRQTELPVVDATGLEGSFNLKLFWRPERARPTVTGVDEAMERPTLFDALPQQLGLRLESRKMPMEILVIDRAEKPTEN